MTNVLLVGETWVSNATHFKGFDSFQSTSFHNGATDFLNCFNGSKFTITQMENHRAPEEFPTDLKELKKYDIIILSDIGANSLLLHPEVWFNGGTIANRLKLIEEFVLDGGGLLMVGGYLTFQGINGSGFWAGTPVERVLPVTISKTDDRLEMPDGTVPLLIDDKSHALINNLSPDFKPILGANKVTLKDGVSPGTLMVFNYDDQEYPLLAASSFGDGKSAVWTSDMGPHWLSSDFMKSSQFKLLWENVLTWLSN